MSRRLPIGVYLEDGIYFAGISVKDPAAKTGYRYLRRRPNENTEEAALALRREAEKRIAKGQPPFPTTDGSPRGRYTVHVLAEAYRDYLNGGPRTRTAKELNDRRVKTFESSILGSKLSETLTVQDLALHRTDRFAVARAKGRSVEREATVNRELQWLQTAFKWAVGRRLIRANVFETLTGEERGCVFPPEDPDGQARPMRRISDDNFERYVAAFPKDRRTGRASYEAPLRLAFILAGRESEVFNIRRGDVSDTELLIRGLHRVRRGGGSEFRSTKGKATRRVKLTPEMRSLLGDLSSLKPEDFVFSFEGRPMLAAFGKASQTARRRSGLNWIRPHMLRAERACRMLDMNGGNYEQVAAAIGWASVETLIKFYSKMRGQQDAANLFEAASREVVKKSADVLPFKPAEHAAN